MTIKNRILATTAAVFALSAIVFGLFLSGSAANRREAEIIHSAEEKASRFNMRVSMAGEAMLASAGVLASSEKTLAALRAKNHDEFGPLTGRVATELKNRLGIDRISFIDLEGTVVFRSDKIDQYGDTVTDPLLERARKSAKPQHGPLLGSGGDFSIVAVYPVSDGHEVAGYISMAKPFTALYREMVRLGPQLLVSGAVLISNTAAETAKFRPQAASETAAKLYAIESFGDKIQDQLRLAKADAPAISGTGVSMIRYVAGKELAISYIPLKDAAGRPVGFAVTAWEPEVDETGGVMPAVLVFLLVFGGAGVAYYLTFRKSISALASIKRTIAEIGTTWDMTKKIEVDSDDEIGELAAGVNSFLKKFDEILKGINEAINKLGTTAEGLYAHSIEIETHASDQASKASAVATASAQMNVAVETVVRSAQGATEAATGAGTAASSGQNLVARSVEGMHGIESAVSGISSVIEQLGQRSLEIGTIINTINDIADQTNLLALNAAIEAARAGEQGRGFAVVADEVRKLAERTTKATKEIGQMIESIQDRTREAVTAMERGREEVRVEVGIAQEAGDSLSNIVSSVQNLSLMIRQITTSAEEQSAGVKRIGEDISSVAQVTGQTARVASELANLSGDLQTTASDLHAIISTFKLD